jgi:sporulation protein YlmC with PRC-barrel domain
VVKYYSTGHILKDNVMNDRGENLGKVEDLVIDLETGGVLYAVLAFGGGGLLSRGKYFAVPWELLDFSTHDRTFILNIPRETIERAAGYDNINKIFESPDTTWLGNTYDYYSNKPEWEQTRADERQQELEVIKQRRAGIRNTMPAGKVVR